MQCNVSATTDIQLDEDGFGKFSVLAIERSDGNVGSVDVF